MAGPASNLERALVRKMTKGQVDEMENVNREIIHHVQWDLLSITIEIEIEIETVMSRETLILDVTVWAEQGMRRHGSKIANSKHPKMNLLQEMLLGLENGVTKTRG
jgi:hypothetical protein